MTAIVGALLVAMVLESVRVLARERRSYRAEQTDRALARGSVRYTQEPQP